MGKQKFEEGALIRISLGPQSYSYGRLLKHPFIAFYDLIAPDDSVTPAALADRPILFVLAVMDRAITSGRWKIVDRGQPDAADIPIPDQFMQDRFNPARCRIIDASGEARPATPDECQGLEAAAVWDAEHVEERIRDHHAGRTNMHFESLKLKQPPNKG